MPWSGASGSQTYSRTDGTRTGADVWQQAKAASVKVVANGHDTHDQDIATALNAVLKKDGGNTATADLPMGGNKHTGVENAAARDQYAAAGQVQDGSLIWCGTAGGTANALTLTPTPAITAYATGMELVFKAGSSASTSTVTISVSGLAAKAAEFDDAALSATVTIEAGKYYRAIYDGTALQLTRLSLVASAGSGIAVSGGTVTADPNNATDTAIATGDEILFADADDSNAVKKDTIGGVLDLAIKAPTVTQYTSGSGTHNVTAGTRWMRVLVVGGGGGGGGASGGASNGSASSFGAVNCAGGTGGPAAGNAFGGLGGTGGSGTIGTTIRFDGNRGGGVSSAASGLSGGSGGDSVLFSGGAPSNAGNGNNGLPGVTNSGGGGGGASTSGGTPSPGGGSGESAEIIISSPAASYSYAIGAGGAGGAGSTTGGAGAAGRVIVYEY